MESNRSRSALFIPVLLLALGLSGQNPKGNVIPIFKNLSILDGLSNNEVKQIVQDETGFIWLATGSGIDRYDGYQIQPFAPPLFEAEKLEKLSWRPMKLAIDTNNNYYMASDFAGLMMYEQSTNVFKHFTSQNSFLPDNTINSLALDNQGRVWIGSQRGLAVLEPGTFTINQPFPFDEAINKVMLDEDQRIWLALSNGSLRIIQNGQIQVPKALSSIVIHSLFSQGRDTLLIATDLGVYQYQVKTEVIKEIFKLPPGSTISDMIMDQQGNIWAGTFNQGLFYYHSQDARFYQFRHETGNQQSIASDHIATLFEDRQGNIWIGTYGDGVSIVSNNLFQIKVHYQPVTNSISSNSVSQVITSTDGDIWYHNGQDLMRISSSGFHSTFTLPFNMLCGDQINAITEFNGDFLLATECEIYRWSPQNPDEVIPMLTEFPAVPKKQILSLSYHRPRLLIGTTLSTDSEGLWIFDFDHKNYHQFRADGKIGSMVGNQVTTTLEASNGDLWIATWDDLNLYRPEAGFVAVESIINECECLKGGSTVISIFEDHRGFIWFGRIDNGGLIVIDPVTLNNHCFRIEDGLPDNSVTTILQDAEQNIWVGTYRGAAKIQYPEDPFNPGKLVVQIIGKAEGLPNPTLWNGGIQRGKEKIYFGTRDGMMEFSTNLNINDHPPKTILSKFEIVQSKSKASTPEIIFPNAIPKYLKPKEKVFTIEFAAEDFYRSTMTAFAYRFSNLDTNWINLGNQHSITFANLASGTYQFETKAKLTNSDWGPSQPFTLVIIPPIYQRWWFITFLIFFALWLVYAFQQYRIYQLKKIQQVREEISRDLHDEIGSALSNIEILSGMAVINKINHSSLFQRILDTAKNSNEALHQIVWNMNPANSELDIVIPYLSEYAARSLEGSDISLHLQDDSDGQSIRIDVAKRKDLFLSFKEAITNIIKHSRATEVSIYFQYKDQRLSINIVDNGMGIVNQDRDAGNGIKNMKARMERWKGKALLSASTPEGTHVKLEMPIP